MPLYWTIDSKERLFTGSGEGDVALADAMALLDALAGARALSYRKLFDGRAVQSTMTADEVLAVSASCRPASVAPLVHRRRLEPGDVNGKIASEGTDGRDAAVRSNSVGR